MATPAAPSTDRRRQMPTRTSQKRTSPALHFHGDRANFPLTAIIVNPNSNKARTLLLGQYFSPDETAQIVQPREVMDALLERIVMIRSYMIAVIGVISLVTVLTMTLVMVLSIRLRRAELLTMSKIGCSRFTIALILGNQIAVLVAGAVVATILTLLTNAYGSELVRLLFI